tara:strand:+ start:8595 stop:9476 length:882 start_codon:yes stop_codon:yes gene_type:complete
MNLNPSRKIKKVKIENFQSWKEVEVDFDSFNIIEGKSSSGKTAIIRAILMVLQNDWDTSWLRKGENKARVSLFYDDGTVLIRCRGNENSVVLMDNNGKSQKWVKDIATNYPPEIDDVIQMDGYNFSSQFDGHFFIGLSPNKRAEALGEFSDLSKIDQLISLNQKNIRQSNSTSKFLTETIDSLLLDKERVDDIKISLPSEQQINEVNQLINQTVKLKQYLQKIIQLKEFDAELKLVQVLQECLDLYHHTKRLSSHLETVKIKLEIEKLELERKSLQDQIEGSVCPICHNVIKL